MNPLEYIGMLAIACIVGYLFHKFTPTLLVWYREFRKKPTTKPATKSKSKAKAKDKPTTTNHFHL